MAGATFEEWRAGYGVIRHRRTTQQRIGDLAGRPGEVDV